jgi:hypothetical protein
MLSVETGRPRAVGLYMREGWKAPIMFYRFKCKVCGKWVVNYRMGCAERLVCPICGDLAKLHLGPLD